MTRRHHLLTWLFLLAVLGLPVPAGAVAQLINGDRTHAGATNYGVSTGTGAAYVLTLNAAIPGYVNGSCYLMQAHTPNTGPATLNVNGRGARVLKKYVGGVQVDLAVGDIIAGQLVEACTDGTFMQTTFGGGTGTGVTDGDKGDITVMGNAWTIDPNAITYAKLQNMGGNALVLGRGASGIGPPQEITLGPNCSMTGTQLNCTGGASGAPLGAPYWTSSVDATLTNETNLGVLLSTGLIKATVTGGSATPSTALPGTDYIDPASLNTALAAKQDAVTWAAGLTFSGGAASVLSTETGFLQDGGATPLTCGVGQQGKLQVMDNGDLQYCDGATTSALKAGPLGHVIQDEGTARTNRAGLNFIGALINCVDNPGANRTDCTISSGSSSITVTEIDGTPTGSFGTIKFSNGSVTDNGDGSVSVVTGGGGGGDVSSTTTTTVIGQMAIFATTGGKTIAPSTTAGILKGAPTTGVISAAVAGTDYVDPTGLTTALTAKQDVVTWGAGLAATGATARVDSTEVGFLADGGVTSLTCGAGQQGKVQVMDTGELQYCDGAATSLLRQANRNILDEGTPLALRAAVNFTGTTIACTDNAGANRTDCAVTPGLTNPMTAPGDWIVGGTAGAATRLPAGTGFLRGAAASTPTFGELTGDVTTSGYAATVARVNGVAYPASPTTNTLPMITASNTAVYKFIPDCDDTLGQHLNYDHTTQVWLCGNSTRPVPAFLVLTNPASISVDASLYNEVSVTDLNTSPVNLDAPTGTPFFEGQRLRYAIYDDVSRALTYTTTTNGFAGEAGLNLPTKTVAQAYLVLEFRYSAQSSRWALWSVSDRRPKVNGPGTIVGDIPTLTINADTTELVSNLLPTSTQAGYTFNNPLGTPFDGQFLRVRISTPTTAKTLTWSNLYSANAGLALPTMTTGSAQEDLFGFTYNATSGFWVMTATTQASLSARRKTCAILISTKPNALTNAELTDEYDYCEVPSSATLEEIRITASGGTPSVTPVTRTGITNTNLVTSALSTAAAGALACTRLTGTGTTSTIDGVTTCAQTLQGTTLTRGHRFGIATGTAGGTAIWISVQIHFLLSN